MNSWPSWMRGVSVDGTRKQMSLSGASLPPPSPVKPTTATPRARAASAARMMFGELPEVEIATSTSPVRPSASTWRAKV